MTTLRAPAAMNDPAAAARRAANSPWLDRLARVGLAARGLVYVLVALLAAQIAFGDHGEGADQTGAFQTLAQNGFGKAVLWLVAAGFVGYALWQVTEAVWGHRDADGGKRLAERAKSAAKALLYGALAVAAARTAAGSSGEERSSETVAARLLGVTGGRELVGLAGVAVLGIAAYLTYKGLRTKFEDCLDLHRMSESGRQATKRLGQVGYVARGVVFAILGVLVIAAAVTFDPSKARGFDAALSALAAQPHGKWLLLTAALGLACFGVYSFVESRYHRL